MKHIAIILISFLMFSELCLRTSSAEEPRACRSVHLFFPSEEGTAFYNEIAVEKSAPGTYFMACGFSKGYFGIQELGNGKKIVLFSVWEPGKQNNPNATPEERRVKEIASGKNVRVKRFGGEGTGGQSFYDYEWKIGQSCRFVVYAKPDGDRTEYAGYFYIPEENRWQHMATFSTLADKHLLRGFYSFVEDFRRNGESAKQPRRMNAGNGWAKVGDRWQPLIHAKFSADQTKTDNIDAGTNNDRFFLATGGETVNENEKLWSKFSVADVERLPPLDLPDPFGVGTTKSQRLRILSYNIKHGRGNDNRVDLARSATVIRRLNPDVVALQEIDNKVDRSGKIDEPEFLSRTTGLAHHAFSSFFDYGGGQYGMALLSRYPIQDEESVRLPKGAEPRTSLVAKIETADNESFTIADVHFYATQDERLAQAKALLEHLENVEGDVVVAGDFNSTADSPILKLFAEDWIVPDKGKDHLTFHAAKPTTEIDFAMIRKGGSLQVDKIDVIDEPVISDHRPVVMEISKIESGDQANSNQFSRSFTITQTKSEAKITGTQKSAVLVIDKPVGIDSLTLIRKEMKWPDLLTIQLHTQGLEGLNIASNGIVLKGGLSSTGGNVFFELKKSSDAFTRIDETDNDWPKLFINAKNKRLPLKDGWFEFAIPASMLGDNDPEIEISWIDFYR